MRRMVAQVKRYWVNGTETWLDTQVRMMAEFDPLIFAEAVNPAFPIRYPVHIPPQRGGMGRRLFRAAKQLAPSDAVWFARSITVEGARLIHAHFGTDARYFLPVVDRTGLPLVVTFHGHDAYRFPRTFCGLGAWYYRRLWERASRVLTVSQHMLETLVGIGCPREKLSVMKVGIDLSLFNHDPPSAASGIRFGCVAAFRPKKGLPTLVEAFARAQCRLPDSELLLIGDGPLRRECEGLAQRLGIAGSVRFVGHLPLDGVAEALRTVNVYVQPSVTASNGDKEGIPVTLMEAMARGLPCISTRHSGIPELIEDGVSGRLVSENDVPSLANTMVDVATDARARERFSEAGRAKVELEHDLTLQTQKLEALYGELVPSFIGAVTADSSAA